MKRIWRFLRPIRVWVIVAIGLLWILSYRPGTQRLANQTVLLNPPAFSIGWANGSIVVARTASIPKRQYIQIDWKRHEFAYQRYDLERAQPSVGTRPVTFKAFDFKCVRVPFWCPMLLVLASAFGSLLARML